MKKKARSVKAWAFVLKATGEILAAFPGEHRIDMRHMKEPDERIARVRISEI